MRLSVIVPFHRRLDQLARCLQALRQASDHLDAEPEIIVASDGSTEDAAAIAAAAGAHLLKLTGPRGPATARNRAAAHASGDALVFVDSDVIVHPDALRRIQRAFDEAPGIDAVFGAYDDDPGDEGFVSQTKNLAHAFVHRQASRRAVTFWAGLGAVRTAAFRRVSGFDERFLRPSVEDIDLGYRLTAAGSAIAIDPAIRGSHLKRWSVWGALVSDVRDRGIPWTQLVHRYGQLRSDLNLSHRYRACIVFAWVAVLALLVAGRTPWMAAVAAAAVCAVGVLDRPYLAFVARQRGWSVALRAYPLRVAHHLANGGSFLIGTAVYLARRALGVSLPGALPMDAWDGSKSPPLRDAGRLRRTGGLAVLLLGTCLLVGRGLGDESVVLVGNDDIRYVMNGVFLHDAIGDGAFWTFGRLLDYARHYYAQYPALSLGFHPPLLSVAEVPALAIAGVSLTAARFTVAIFYLGAVLMLYALVAKLAGRAPAWVAGALFATNPALLFYGHHVLSEIPTLALVSAAAFLLNSFCRRERRRDLVAFVVVSAASVYAKQLAGLLFPAYAAYALLMLGPRRLMQRDLWIAAIGLAVLVLPMVPMTLALSARNVAWVSGSVSEGIAAVSAPASLAAPVWTAITGQFSTSMLVLAAIGLLRIVILRARPALILVCWLAAAMASVMLVTRAIGPERYGVYMMPPVIGLAALASHGWRWRGLRAGVLLLTAFALLTQTVDAIRQPLARTTGYAEAARFVLANPRGATILYSAERDTGLFVFFARKHDPTRRAVVLRADKLLVTAAYDRVVEDRIVRREDIYALLHRFGVGYVVLEDRPTASAVLNWLRDETRTDRFVERFRAPIVSSRPGLEGASVSVYEFLDASPPDPEAVIDFSLPLARAAIAVRLKDLLDGTYRRRGSPD